MSTVPSRFIRSASVDRDTMTPKDIFDNYCKDRPEFRHFQNYKDIKFATKLPYLHKKNMAKNDRAREDAAALAHDQLIFPPRTKDANGHPIWAGSEAQRLPRHGIMNGKHLALKPKLRYESREQYHETFDQDIFQREGVSREESTEARSMGEGQS